jgi:hypothetical protein
MATASKKFIFNLWICSLIFISGICSNCFGENNFHAGFIYDQFPLKLDSGKRTEAAGPFFYEQEKDSEKTWALPPLFSHESDPSIEQSEDDFLYPLLTYENYGKEYRWQLIQLFSFSGGQTTEDSNKKEFTIFPFYFQQRSPDTNENYTALFRFTATSTDGCSATKFSSSCFRFTAKRRSATL